MRPPCAWRGATTSQTHKMDCPEHDESTCVVCREPAQDAIAFVYQPRRKERIRRQRRAVV